MLLSIDMRSLCLSPYILDVFYQNRWIPNKYGSDTRVSDETSSTLVTIDLHTHLEYSILI
jgi:hypothetical protein